MRTSEQIDDIMVALANAQSEFPSIPKNRDGYGYKYADLADTMALIKPILQKHGLMLIQPLDVLDSGCFVVITRLVHKHQWIEGFAPIPAGIKAQEAGAWVTYLRRYSLSMLGIITEDDNDGVVKKPERTPLKPKSTFTAPKVMPKQPLKQSEWSDDLDIPL